MNLTPKRFRMLGGFTLTEAVVMVVIVGALAAVALVNLSGMAFGARFRTEAESFMHLMRQAYSGATQGQQRYEMRLDVAQQAYHLRVLTPENYGQPLGNDEIIESGSFSESFNLLFVQFDDGVVTDDDWSSANFRVGRAGWQQGGKILVADESGRTWSIVVNRMTGHVEMIEGDVELLQPVSDASF